MLGFGMTMLGFGTTVLGFWVPYRLDKRRFIGFGSQPVKALENSWGIHYSALETKLAGIVD